MAFLARERIYCSPMQSAYTCDVYQDPVSDIFQSSVNSSHRLKSSSQLLSIDSSVSMGLMGNLNNVSMPGQDIFFLPKPSNLIRFALPVLVFLPNLTIFTKSWPFFASKAY